MAKRFRELKGLGAITSMARQNLIGTLLFGYHRYLNNYILIVKDTVSDKEGWLDIKVKYYTNYNSSD